jgi:putative spermidine/putrescine transport system ATP-binding protein
MAKISLHDISKRFGDVSVLEGVSLDVADGELVALLGPSGCGKTTLLRVLAGLETPNAGTVRVGGEDITGVAPEHRHIGMMFQSYALFPHMTVAQNLAFPLRMRKVVAGEQSARIARALDLVRMTGLDARFPRELSGGQQQRVALARALIDEPRVLLLDEPLSNLDAQLRETMQVELIELRAKLRLTTILVTHDQDEAMSLADRIVLMRAGHIEQIGSPRELYERPASAFAADFIGAANLIPAELEATGSNLWRARLADGTSFALRAPTDARPGARQLMIRMEDLVLTAQPDRWDVALPITLGTMVYRGSHVRQRVMLGNVPLTVEVPKAMVLEARAATHIAWRHTDLVVLTYIGSDSI